MKKRTIAIVIELIPVASAVAAFILVRIPNDSGQIRNGIQITFLLAFLGFAFFLAGRRLAKEDKTVRILGILDWLATISIIGFYILAIFLFGL